MNNNHKKIKLSELASLRSQDKLNDFPDGYMQVEAFNNGGFNLAHLLGVITLLAIGGGVFVEAFKRFPFAKYLQAISYSGTILCSCIPAISEVFTRLPVGNPLADSIFDPILIVSFGVLAPP